MAVALGTFARLVDWFIFQPTYLLGEKSGMRDLLRLQAGIDQRKERYLRGILLSILPNSQEEHSNSAVDAVVDELISVLSLDCVLQAEALRKFGEELHKIVARIQVHWKEVQRGKQKLEPSFAHDTSTTRPWHVVDFRIPGCTSADSKPGLTSNDLQDNTVIFPRLYHMETSADPIPITNGSVLPRSQLEAAAADILNSPARPLLAQPMPGRPRPRSSRKMSMGAEKGRSMRQNGRFLE